MTDAAPATPVPTAVERAATAVATKAANGWSAIVALAPSINDIVSKLAVPALCVALGISGAVGYQKVTAPKLVIQAADPPKAEPIRVVLQPLDRLEARAAAIEAKLDTLIQQTAPKAPVVIPKRTKSAAR